MNITTTADLFDPDIFHLAIDNEHVANFRKKSGVISYMRHLTRGEQRAIVKATKEL